MTPTQQLAAELAMSKAEAQSLRDGLQALVDYCASSKFAADPMVNVQDIFLRVRPEARGGRARLAVPPVQDTAVRIAELDEHRGAQPAAHVRPLAERTPN
jgi:hypothetical protein